MALLHENPFLSFFPKILSQKVLNEVVVHRVPSHDQHKVKYRQCDNIGRNFATLARLFKSLAIFWVLSKYLARFFCLLWQELYNDNGEIVSFENGQTLKNNPAIWSHCMTRNL